MLDYIEKGSDDERAYHCMENFYSQTLESFQSTNNERLWLKTNIKLARLWLDRKEYGQLSKQVRELHRACQKEDGTDDPSKGTYSLEIYALEIQMYADTRNNKRLKVFVNLSWFNKSVLSVTVGLVPASAQSAVCRTASQNYGHHPRVWRQNAYERRSVIEAARDSPELIQEQRTGKRRRVTFSSHFETMTRLARCREYRF